MEADYGYVCSENETGKTLTVDKNRGSVRKAQIITLCLGFIPLGIALAAAGAFAYFLLLVAVVAGVWALIAALRSSTTTFTLAADALLTNGTSYAKKDIKNLSIWEPNGVQVSASNLVTAAGQAAVINAIHAESLAIMFDYGRQRVALAQRLTEPQAVAVTREIQLWLTA